MYKVLVLLSLATWPHLDRTETIGYCLIFIQHAWKTWVILSAPVLKRCCSSFLQGLYQITVKGRKGLFGTG